MCPMWLCGKIGIDQNCRYTATLITSLNFIIINYISCIYKFFSNIMHQITQSYDTINVAIMLHYFFTNLYNSLYSWGIAYISLLRWEYKPMTTDLVVILQHLLPPTLLSKMIHPVVADLFIRKSITVKLSSNPKILIQTFSR